MNGWPQWQAQWQTKAQRMIDWLDQFGVTIGSTHVSLLGGLRMAGVAVLVVVIASVISRIGRRLVRRLDSLDVTQRALSEKLVTVAIWAFAILAGIDALGISLTALTVFSGAFGLAIGFGLQKTFGNLIAGVILLLDRSIKPGDVIAVEGSRGNTFGEVQRIGVRAASVKTLDNRVILIPNEVLMTTQVENWSFASRRVGVNFPLGIAYGSDIALAERLLLEAAATVPRVLTDPAPSVLLHAFGASAIELHIYVSILDPENGVANVRSEVLKAAWHSLKAHGVEIPLPQSDVALRDSDGLRRLAEALAGRGAKGEAG